MMTSRCALTFLVVCAGLVSACGSTSRAPRLGIALDHRIGAVSFGEAKDHVDAALGHGEAKRPDHEPGHWIFYPRAGLYVGYVSFHGEDHALAIITRSPRYKTRSGIGVGSSLDVVRRRMKVSCYGNYCQHQGADARRLLTVFQAGTSTNRVTEVYIIAGH